MFPRLSIYLDNIVGNAEYLNGMCKSKNITLSAVTKVICAEETITRALVERAGIGMLADSRTENLRKIDSYGLGVPLFLLRIPMLSELQLVADHADYTLVSEIKTAEKLLGIKGIKDTRLVFMVDVGDLREGVWFEYAAETIRKVKDIAGDRLVGIGCNVGCFCGVIPDVVNTQIAIDLAGEFDLKMVSTGNTAAIKLIEDGILPEGANHFRVGESIMLGTDVTRNRLVPGLSQKTFILEAEVIEANSKPTVPFGEVGFDAFGRRAKFEDRGIRKRIILGMGEQDIISTGLIPLDDGMKVLHASSDHTIVDVTDCEKEYEIGDIVYFRVSYGTLLKAMTCEYVNKHFVL